MTSMESIKRKFFCSIILSEQTVLGRISGKNGLSVILTDVIVCTRVLSTSTTIFFRLLFLLETPNFIWDSMKTSQKIFDR